MTSVQMRVVNVARPPAGQGWAAATRLLMAGACLAAATVGCGGADFGEDVSLPQSRVHRLAATATTGPWSLKLPGEAGFNVTDTQRRSEGSASASSTASARGEASCAADASTGGAGSAEFQLGQVVSYDGDSPMPATVSFDVAYECRLEHDAPRFGVEPVALKVYVMDSDRRMLAKMMLVEGGAAGLADRWSGSQSPSFDVTFEPGLAYHLIVAGRVEVSGDGTSGPRASLEVRSVGIQVAQRGG